MLEKWTLKNVKGDIDRIANKLNISKITAQIIINRGLKTREEAEIFLSPHLNKLHEPSLMNDMIKATEIILDAIKNDKKILIVGDYDVDGIMSTYILFHSLRECNANVEFQIPHRITDGYGISDEIIQTAHNNNFDLIITCDNGIAALNQIELAKKLGMSVIITDHHDIPFRETQDGIREFVIPPADAIVNPKNKDCSYPFENLCGAGIAYKLAVALFNRNGIEADKADKYLEYASIATICDVVDLVDENRIIVKNGLEMLNHTHNIGLNALIQETGLKDKKITTYEASFVLGPCINATGRIDTATLSLELLLSSDRQEAQLLANKLYLLNEERKEMTNIGIEKAVDLVEKLDINNKKVLVLFIPEIHESIAGIIAGRIKEKYHLPTIVLTKGHEGVKGSGRSIESYNMFEELLKCKDLLDKFGGHPMAAGLSLSEENIIKLDERLNKQCSLNNFDLLPKISIDSRLPFEMISFELIEEIEKLEPFGKANPRPLFAEKNVKIARATILGANKNVLKLKLVSKTNRFIEAIYFQDIEKFSNMILDNFGEQEMLKMYEGCLNNIELDFVFKVGINEYRGNKTIQLIISNYRPAKI